ncbi:MAG: hypothetical protein M1822_004319 [Bathelium mastoideum]|nr:MAG: hypothetical protein M1822_004319 [Bathelium mastoideum]
MRPSARFGQDLPQWFDMWSTEEPHAEKETQLDGLREGIQSIRQIMEAESKLVPASHIFLCGISQGCATAISTLICGRLSLGGFVGLCGWMPYEDKIHGSTDKLTALREVKVRLCGDDLINSSPSSHIAEELDALATPVFISHSQNDSVVPIQHGAAMIRTLQELGMQVTWKEYEAGEHWVNEPQGIDDLVNFLRRSMVRCDQV